MRTSTLQTDVFETYAAAYDNWFDKNQALYQVELEAVRGSMPSIGTGVEIGVGTGRFAAPLGISIGVEPSSKMAEVAKRRGIAVVKAAAEALPFAAGVFDFVLMITVVCFLDDVSLAFREARRILKKQSVLIIAFIDRNSELGQQYEKTKLQSRFFKTATFYAASDLEYCLTDAGFSGFAYRQTLFPDQPDIPHIENGHGKGGFVVVRAVRCHQSMGK